jgi:hypothetical protein
VLHMLHPVSTLIHSPMPLSSPRSHQQLSATQAAPWPTTDNLNVDVALLECDNLMDCCKVVQSTPADLSESNMLRASHVTRPKNKCLSPIRGVLDFYFTMYLVAYIQYMNLLDSLCVLGMTLIGSCARTRASLHKSSACRLLM